MNKKRIATGLLSLVALILCYITIFYTETIEYAQTIDDKLFLSVLLSVLILILWDEYNRRS